MAAMDEHWLGLAVDLSRRCPPSASAYSVGAIVVTAEGIELARGHSREEDPVDHAEEVALRRLPDGVDPSGVDPSGLTLYTSLEPCGVRRSRPRTCADLVLATGIRRVVYGWREPPLLADGGGAERLAAAGVEVVELAEFAADVRQINHHLTQR
jgi:diaminohydroxyphosphoribosylaminopyrimidine deaminase/5-amino-6-(5-phosphoribosylamino)uracil reductase